MSTRSVYGQRRIHLSAGQQIDFSIPSLSDFKINGLRILNTNDLGSLSTTTIQVGTTTTLSPGSLATVVNSGTPTAAIFDFGIPQGIIGATGPQGSIGLTGATGPQGPAGNDGAPGSQGPAGTAATIAVGTTTTLASGSPATVTNTGTSSAAVFNFGIPAGNNGAPGAQGPAGNDGAPGAQGPAGNDGAPGAQGPAGTAATIAVGTTTTLASGSPATVTNTGTSSAAVFNFGIPQGPLATQTDVYGTCSVQNLIVGGTISAATVAGSAVTVTAGVFSLPCQYHRYGDIGFLRFLRFAITTPNSAPVRLSFTNFTLNASFPSLNNTTNPTRIANYPTTTVCFKISASSASSFGQFRLNKIAPTPLNCTMEYETSISVNSLDTALGIQTNVGWEIPFIIY